MEVVPVEIAEWWIWRRDEDESESVVDVNWAALVTSVRLLESALPDGSQAPPEPAGEPKSPTSRQAWRRSYMRSPNR